MFIRELWKQNPNLVKQELMLLLFCRDDLENSFNINNVTEEELVFKHDYGKGKCDYVYVGDFDVFDLTGKEVVNPESTRHEWRQFMARVCGNKYLEALKAEREKKKQSYIQAFDNKTQQMIDDLSAYAQKYENSL